MFIRWSMPILRTNVSKTRPCLVSKWSLGTSLFEFINRGGWTNNFKQKVALAFYFRFRWWREIWQYEYVNTMSAVLKAFNLHKLKQTISFSTETCINHPQKASTEEENIVVTVNIPHEYLCMTWSKMAS
jgi:hypothetical protein